MVKTVVQQALNGLIDDLRATHGDNLASVVLYGAAAADDRSELPPDYNLLIALNRITPEDLRQAQAPPPRPTAHRVRVLPSTSCSLLLETLGAAGRSACCRP